jgi:hypothetical protein
MGAHCTAVVPQSEILAPNRNSASIVETIPSLYSLKYLSSVIGHTDERSWQEPKII